LIELKRLEIARVLATEPALMLLDEVIRKIRDMGITVVMVEYVMRAIMSISKRIVVLQ